MRIEHLIAIALLAGSATAYAGAVIHETRRDLPNGKPVDHETVYVQDGMIRSDTLDDHGHPTQLTIFRDGVMWQVNIARRTYSKLDKAVAQQGMQQLQAMREQMLANAPPERRAAMEKAMAGMQHPAAPIAWTDTGRSEHVAGFSCEVWQGKKADKLEFEYCIARPGDVPDGDEIYAALRQMSASLRDVVSAMQNAGQRDTHGVYNFDWIERAKGYPIVRREFEHEEAVKSIEQQKLPADKFAIPQGFTEVPLLGGHNAE
jgi:hypothetical protein